MDNNKYVVLSRQDAVAKNNSPYINLKVADEEGENMQICVFDVNKSEGPKVGTVITFRTIREYQNKKSASAIDMTVLGEAEKGSRLWNLVPHPVERTEWDECVEHLCAMSADEALIAVIREQSALLYDLYIKYPAATTVHHAFPGGLLNHTYQMLHMLEGIHPTMPYTETMNMKLERMVLAIMFHDWGKSLEYTADGECTKYMYLLGHIYMSAQKLQTVLVHAGVDRDEINLIVHCVLAHHGELEYGSPVKPCTPEAQLVNYLDNISAKADIFNTTGNLERNFALGTSVVK